jgi:hypothetical protein
MAVVAVTDRRIEVPTEAFGARQEAGSNAALFRIVELLEFFDGSQFE